MEAYSTLPDSLAVGKGLAAPSPKIPPGFQASLLSRSSFSQFKPRSDLGYRDGVSFDCLLAQIDCIVLSCRSRTHVTWLPALHTLQVWRGRPAYLCRGRRRSQAGDVMTCKQNDDARGTFTEQPQNLVTWPNIYAVYLYTHTCVHTRRTLTVTQQHFTDYHTPPCQRESSQFPFDWFSSSGRESFVLHVVVR